MQAPERNHSVDLESECELVQSLTAEGNIIDVSPLWLNHTGYLRDEVIGKHFSLFIDDKSIEQVGLNFPHLRDFGFVDNVPLTLIRKDKVHEDVILNGTSKYTKEGQLQQTFCELRTLEYFKNSNEALSKLLAQERFHKVILNLKANITTLVARGLEYD